MKIRLTPRNGFGGERLIDPATVKAHARIEFVVPYLLKDHFGYTTYKSRLTQYGNAKELVGYCPFHPKILDHDDEHPSLRVNAGKQAYFCNPCGIGGDSIDFVQRYFNVCRHGWSPETFAQVIGWLHEHRSEWRESDKNRPVQEAASARTSYDPDDVGDNVAGNEDDRHGSWAAYPYLDAHGRELYQVVRTPSKKFLFRHGEPGEGWVWNGKDIRRVVYMLHAIQDCSRVYVAEGEKDVDTLWSHRLPATTNCGGAGKWTDDYSAQLVKAGVRRVVILPDNDDPGRAHAAAVGRSCQTAGLRVTVVPLPGLPKKGDVTDWFDLGHKRRDLRRVINAQIQRETR